MSNYRPRTFQEYLQLIWRRRRMFFLVAGAMLISTFVVIGKIPDQYYSSASVVVAGQQEDRQAVAARVATITERVNSRSFLEPLIEKHALYPRLVSAGAMEVAVNRMRKDIKVESRYRNDTPEAVTVTYRNPNPEVATVVASDLLSAFGRMNEAIEQQTEERAKQINSELTQIETRLRQLGEQQAIASSRSRAASLRSQQAAAQSSVEALNDKQYALEQQIAEQKRQIEEQAKIASTAPSDARSGGSYGVLLVKQAELQGQLKDYQTQYTQKNPKVIQTRTQLSEIDRQIAQLNSASGQDGVPLISPEARELRSMQRELSRMNIELEVTKREAGRRQPANLGLAASIRSVPGSTAAADVPIADVASETDKDRLRTRYDALLKQQDELERVQIQAAGLDPGLFQIIDHPVQPILPAGPDRWKLRLIAIALAIAFGLIVVATLEAPRLFAIHDDRDVRYYLGTRVVALIPETLTPAERGRARKMLAARTVGLLLLTAVLVPVLVAVLNGLRIFQLMANRW